MAYSFRRHRRRNEFVGLSPSFRLSVAGEERSIVFDASLDIFSILPIAQSRGHTSGCSGVIRLLKNADSCSATVAILGSLV